MKFSYTAIKRELHYGRVNRALWESSIYEKVTKIQDWAEPLLIPRNLSLLKLHSYQVARFQMTCPAMTHSHITPIYIFFLLSCVL